MYRRYLCLSLWLLMIGSFPLVAQTARIAHKSHSGSATSFEVAHRDFDHYASNFGMVPTDIVRTARLDSVIYLDEMRVVMVTSDECKRGRRQRTSVWRAGRDTVHNHTLFRHRHRLDSIRMVLDRDYYFTNEAHETVFVGYDNEVPEPVAVPAPPATQPPSNQNLPTIQPRPSKPQGQGAPPAQTSQARPGDQQRTSNSSASGKATPLMDVEARSARSADTVSSQKLSVATIPSSALPWAYLLAGMLGLWGISRWWQA